MSSSGGGLSAGNWVGPREPGGQNLPGDGEQALRGAVAFTVLLAGIGWCLENARGGSFVLFD